MGFELDIFNSVEADGSTSSTPLTTCLLTTGELDADFLEWLVDEHSVDIQKHFTKLWEYYSNPTYELSDISSYDKKAGESGRCYVQAQEYGLPARITGLVHCGDAGVFGGRAVKDVQRKEVVVENDIAWRINAAVDFLFGKPVSFVSRSPDSQKRTEIEAILKAVFAANGGIVPRQHAFDWLTWSQLSAREFVVSFIAPPQRC